MLYLQSLTWLFLKQWTQYLVKFGADPGEQLCTDDFAGHLSHNVNLSAKAIMGIEAYARLAAQLGRTEEAEEYHAKAAEMAKRLGEARNCRRPLCAGLR